MSGAVTIAGAAPWGAGGLASEACSSRGGRAARRRLALQTGLVFRFFAKMELENFEIASDAFQTFKVPPSPPLTPPSPTW